MFKALPAFLVLASLSLASCGDKDGPKPTTPPPVTPPVMSATQKLLIGKWTLQTQVFSTQSGPTAPQVFGPVSTYPSNQPATTFEFKSDGTADYVAAPSNNTPGPGRSEVGPYVVDGDMKPTANIVWDAFSKQTLNINTLTATSLVLDKRSTVNGVTTTEQRTFKR